MCSPWRKPWDPTGALRRGGRWNNPGVAVLYAASSISLACLEILVHLVDTTIIPDFVYSEIEIPDGLVKPWTENERRTEAILGSSLLSREFGDSWLKRPIRSGGTDPAFVTPEWNYLINPKHEVFRELTWSEPRSFRIDPRLIDPALR